MAYKQLEAVIPGFTVNPRLEEGSRNVRLTHDHLLTVTQKTDALLIPVRTLWNPVVLDPEFFTVMPGIDSVIILGRVTLDELGPSLKSQTLRLAWARRPMAVSGIEDSDYTRPVAGYRFRSAFQDGQSGELEPGASVEEMIYPGMEMFMDPEEVLRACEEALEPGVEEATAKGLLEDHVGHFRELLYHHIDASRRPRPGDSPERVEPMAIKFKPVAKNVKIHPRRYDPTNNMWLARLMAALAPRLPKFCIISERYRLRPLFGFREVTNFRFVVGHQVAMCGMRYRIPACYNAAISYIEEVIPGEECTLVYSDHWRMKCRVESYVSVASYSSVVRTTGRLRQIVCTVMCFSKRFLKRSDFSV